MTVASTPFEGLISICIPDYRRTTCLEVRPESCRVQAGPSRLLDAGATLSRFVVRNLNRSFEGRVSAPIGRPGKAAVQQEDHGRVGFRAPETPQAQTRP